MRNEGQKPSLKDMAISRFRQILPTPAPLEKRIHHARVRGVTRPGDIASAIGAIHGGANALLHEGLNPGERISYKPVTSIEEVQELLTQLGCENLISSQKDGQITGLTWTVGGRSLVIGTPEDGGFGFEGLIDGKTVTKEAYRELGPHEVLGYIPEYDELSESVDDEGEVIMGINEPANPADGMSGFLHDFLNEPHNVIADTDRRTFGYAGNHNRDKDPRIQQWRIGGVYFAFVMEPTSVSPIKGHVYVQEPVPPKSKGGGKQEPKRISQGNNSNFPRITGPRPPRA